MKDIWLRIIVAALISASGIFATYIWSERGRVKFVSTGSDPVAILASSRNEVQRRPARRLIWQNVLTRQELYAGEAVRTASNADARIEFIGLGTVIDLEPDTVIEIQQADGEINLDFLKGNLFIRSSDAKDKITVKSGDEKIAVSNSEVVVSKPTTTAKLDLEVVKGEVKDVSRGEGVKSVVKPPSIPPLKVLKPKQGELVYFNPETHEPIEVAWEPLNPAYVVKLEVGSSRDELKASEPAQVVAGDKGRMTLQTEGGKSYFRLIAEAKDGLKPVLKSPIVRFEARAVIAPILIEPAKGASIDAAIGAAGSAATDPKAPKTIAFRWANPGLLEDLTIEIARSKDLKTSLIAKNKGADVQGEFPISGGAGPVYWRVSGRLANTTRMISSAVQSFNIKAVKGEEPPMIRPVLLEPTHGKVHPWTTSKGELKLKWGPVEGAERYNVTLIESLGSETRTTTRETAATELVLKAPHAGSYQWRVSAKGEGEQKSPESETREFRIDSLPPLRWADGKTSERLIYRTAKPKLRLSWLKGPEYSEGVKWRTRLTSEREPATEDAWLPTNEPMMAWTLEGPGRFRVEAEALAPDGTLLAAAPVRLVEFEPAPLVAAPEINGAKEEPINGTDTGSAEISWKPVRDASQYSLVVKDKDGNVIKSLKTEKTEATLTELPPGDYQVVMQSTDTSGRAGLESLPRALKVPEYSDVQAPKLKRINIK